jgi:hypothetical protein
MKQTKKCPVTSSGAAPSLRPVSAGGPSAWPGPARVRCEKTDDRFSISVVSSRDGQRAGRCPVRRRCTGVIGSCTSRQTVYAVGSGGVVKAHPKWQSTTETRQKQKGPEPFGVRASLGESLEGMRLCATSTRYHLILELANAQAACGLRRMHVVLAQIRLTRRHVDTIARPLAHERPARCGSNVGEGQCGVHDGS